MMNNIDDVTPNEAEEIKNPVDARPVTEEPASARGGIDQEAFQRQLKIDIEADENDVYMEEEVDEKSLDKQIDEPNINR
ncbi:MAG: hypothetical protein J6A47_01350 [Bacilli bacterium]|nr:hypothetical protein [Bacilli bacterium]